MGVQIQEFVGWVTLHSVHWPFAATFLGLLDEYFVFSWVAEKGFAETEGEEIFRQWYFNIILII